MPTVLRFFFSLLFRVGRCDILQSWHWLLSHVRFANGVVRLSQCKAHLSPRFKPAGQKRKWKCHANVFVML